MKMTIKKLFSAVLVLVFCILLGLTAYSANEISDATSGRCGDGLTWKLTDDGVLIISGNGKMYDYSNAANNYAPWSSYHNTKNKIVIGNGVTYIGAYAFENCTSVTEVTIPDSVTSIGDYAFYRCSSLSSITIPGSVEKLGSDVFYYCTSLTDVTISEGVSVIGKNAFTGCSSLKTVTIPASVTEIGKSAFVGCDNLTAVYAGSNSRYTSSDGVLIDKNSAELIYYPVGKKDSSFTIPEEIKSIGSSAFENNTYLTSMEIPNGVTSIGAYAFENCTSLKNVTIPNSVISIGDQAFYGCTGIKSITIPDSVTLLGKSAFTNCTNLSEIKLSDNITAIYDMTFYGCTSLTDITIPEGVTSIGDKAFADCSSLTSITIPGSVVSLGNESFLGTNIKNVTYSGTAEQWNNLDKGLYNECLTEAEIIYEEAEEAAGRVVKVVIGSQTVSVSENGSESTYTMDTAPYIQPESSSTLVPLRFVTTAVYGSEADNTNSSDIIAWDSDAKTASITVGDNLITFTAGDNYMTVNGEKILMSNGVKAEITDGRMFIPFRSLGEALGVSVNWESETKTAVYSLSGN